MKSNSDSSLPELAPFFIFISLFLILFILKSGVPTKKVQISVLLFISYYTIMTNPVTYQVGYILFIFIYFLAMKYRVYSNKVLFNTSVILFLFLAILGSLILFDPNVVVNEEITGWHIPNQINFIITTILLIFIVFEEDIIRLTLENQKLNSQIEKSSVFVNLGENIAGLVHNMNGDLGLMTMSVSMLEEEVDHKAIGFIKTGNRKLQDKIRNILTLAKYSQTDEDMEFSINALLFSLLEVFSINRDYKINKTETDFRREVMFFGNPSEISQVFENLIKNAYEALGEKAAGPAGEGRFFEGKLSVSVDSTPHESSIVFRDNGPGIKACIDKKCEGDCVNCNIFRVGKTTKEEGTGLGMVSVLRTLDKYKGRLRISTSPEGSEITVVLPRESLVSVNKKSL